MMNEYPNHLQQDIESYQIDVLMQLTMVEEEAGYYEKNVAIIQVCMRNTVIYHVYLLLPSLIHLITVVSTYHCNKSHLIRICII